MRVGNLWWFWWRRLRTRRVREAFALVGIAAGVALLFAVQISSASLNGSVNQLVGGLVGAAQLQLEARDQHGIDEAVIDRVGRLAGVRAAAPVLDVQANAVGADGRERAVTLLAADARLARLGGRLVSGYAASRLSNLAAVALPVAVARALDAGSGSSITLQVAGRVQRAPVSKVVGRGDVGALTASPIVMTSLRYGQRLTGLHGRVMRVYVAADPGRVDAVARELRQLAGGTADVRSSDADVRVFHELATPYDKTTALFAGISAIIAFLFAFNAMLVGTHARRALIADLRASCFGTLAVLEVLLFDALMLGLAASALGVGLGCLLSAWLFAPEPGYLTIAFPIGTARVVEPRLVALAIGCGVAAAVAATLAPVLTTVCSRAPIDVVADDGRDRARFVGSNRRAPLLLAGVAMLLAAVTVSRYGSPAATAALAGVGLLVVAMLLCLPALLAGALTLADRARRRISATVPVIPVGELVSPSARSLAIAAVAATVVCGTTAIQGARGDLQHGLDASARELSHTADVWVTARGATNLLATVAFDPASATRAISTTPGVAAIGVYRGSFLDTGDRRMWVIAPPAKSRDPIPRSQIVRGDLAQATARLRAGGWAVASEAIAAQLHLRIGRPFTLASPHPARLRLAAITTNFGWSPGTMVLGADDYARAWGTTDASALQVTLRAGVPSEVGARAVEAALGAGAPFEVQTAAEREASFRATTRSGLARLQWISELLLLTSVLATAGAIAALIWQRRQRLADHKLTSRSPGSLWTALARESTLLLAIGSAIGAVFGLIGQQLLDRALNTVTGFPVDHSVAIGSAGAALAFVTVIAVVIVAVPGYVAARVPSTLAVDQ